MRVNLLGPVVARVGDGVVDLGGTKQRAVFALLAMRAGRVVAMDRLIDDLWHEEPPARATVTLRAYVSRLRRALESAGHEFGTEVPEIRTQPPGWVLTLGAQDVDLIEFHARVERARALLTAADDAQPTVEDLRTGTSLLVSALELWHGDVLADLASLDVARAEAARTEDVRLTAIELLLETRLGLGEHQQVVDDARTFVTRHPFRERAWAALMLALYRSGRQSDAMSAMGELRGVLLDELGMDPSPPLQRLEQQVLRQDPALLPASSLLPRTPAPPVVNQEAPESDSGLVVGRVDTLRLVDQVLTAARTGRGHLLVIEAESGAGKSTVLDLLAERAIRSGRTVVRGSSGGAGAMPALWSWVTVVRALETFAYDDGTQHESGPAATALALMGTAPGTRGPAEVTFSRTALFRGVTELLGAAHRNSPLTVIFDDLQWVDAETLTLLSLAVSELTPAGVVFAVGVRTGDPDAQRVLEALDRTPRTALVRHELAGLDARAVGDVVRAIAGSSPSSELVSALIAVTAGNALFVTEIVRLLAAERRLDVEAVTTALPERVHGVLRQRIARLPAPTSALVQISAVARSPIDLDLLAAVVGEDPDQVLDDVEPALLSGLLVERPDGTGFVPSHDLVRQAVLLGLSSARRIRLHARLAAALQDRGQLGPENVLEVAHHLGAAAPAVGPAAAIPYLISASEDALSRYATITAGRILEEALDAAQRIEEPGRRSQIEQQVRGRLAMIKGYVGVEASLPSGRVDPALPVDDASLAAWVGTVTMTAARGELAWARGVARRALERSLAPAGEVAAQSALGWTSLAMGDLESARAALDRVIDLYASGSVGGITGLFNAALEVAQGYRAMLAHLDGDDAGANSIMDEARRRPEVTQTGEVNMELQACLIACARGDAAPAMAGGTRMISMAAELEYPVFDLLGQVICAWATAMSTTEADPAPLAEAIERYHTSGLVRFGSTFAALLAEVRLRSGDRDGAVRAAERADRLTADSGEVIFGPRLSAVVAGLR